MIIMDTNVISETLRPRPNPHVIAWLRHVNIEELTTTSITTAELFDGICRMPRGRRRSQLAKIVDYALMPFMDRILPFDGTSALDYAQIRAHREAIGRPISVQDAMIAAIARSRGAMLATRNVRDFEHTGVTLIDPWKETALR